MYDKIVSAILNWVLMSVILPVSYVVVDYFKMKKTIKQLNEEINALKSATSLKDKIDASNNIP